MTKTTNTKISDVKVEWHFIDASGKVLGRLAAEIAELLIGKSKSIYTPNLNVGDKVVVTNAAKIAVTGNKLNDKLYHRYTGFPGGIRVRTLKEQLTKNPTEALRLAIKGMLPKNKLLKTRLANLYLYVEAEHPHEAQLSKNIKEQSKE